MESNGSNLMYSGKKKKGRGNGKKRRISGTQCQVFLSVCPLLEQYCSVKKPHGQCDTRHFGA